MEIAETDEFVEYNVRVLKAPVSRRCQNKLIKQTGTVFMKLYS
jgi:hypothetical protein